MYSSEVRDIFFTNTIEKLKSIKLIEGIIQLGSGVTGYKDDHSDIDLMVCTAGVEDVEETKNQVYRSFSDITPYIIKEKRLRENVFLLIVFMENSLEFNVSIVQTDLLRVKSPLWKVVFDKTGMVTEKMNLESERFNQKPVKYPVQDDVVFEFFYSSLKLDKELKRNNLIYALKMLETMRDCTLQVQAMNENKKLHQFKAYETLNPSFIQRYLSTYPDQITAEKVEAAAIILKELFIETVEKSEIHMVDHELKQFLAMYPFSCKFAPK
ncbi:aminoglycoside 6-adenylyltransferase [Bacillus haimaensis]|uniref:aminoglycoside 6-adenylyltransferase n=1 Tax=Bacillus haimaensis TaxID=3160967 RepID=UPI003AA87722